ncbi:hypothetical protein [Natronorubrum tibetense]|uniref:DUF8159 domain-containing protein n=1 Tax=Natronorubrum tibetense GA33 TaxID=1114856 RepID=L9W8T3_9EURY|nr:hypothetical protein [Natronorubrum tibetense]ELY45767.1 hypothetical protein C496_02457 [Natronorubrum tibetense GA33]
MSWLVLPIAVVLLSILTVVAVASNYRNVAGRLSELPGVDAGGGVQTGFIAGLYALVLWSVVVSGGMLLVGGDSGATGADAYQGPGADAPDPDEASASGEYSDAELLVFFETIASHWGVDVTSTELVDDEFVVEYADTTETEEEFTNEVGTLIGVYIDIVEGGLEAERMDVTAVDEDDDSERTWHVESELAEAYIDGEFTVDEVYERVLETVDSA